MFRQAPDSAAACADQPGWWCDQVYRWTDNRTLAEIVAWVVDRPLKILFIVLAAFVVNRLVRRGIRHLPDRMAAKVEGPRAGAWWGRAPNVLLPGAGPDPRVLARLTTLTALLSSATSVLVWGIATIMVLNEVGVSIAPLLASAGIAGVALGFGAQSLVRDVISGIFMLLEDQFGVGDEIDVGPASGIVEGITLRSTRLRDSDGTVWHVPNGEIRRVGNRSQQWTRAVLDVRLPLGVDVERARTVLAETARAIAEQPSFARDVLEVPEVCGVEELSPDGITVRLVVRVRPGTKDRLLVALREQLLQALPDAGIALAP